MAWLKPPSRTMFPIRFFTIDQSSSENKEARADSILATFVAEGVMVISNPEPRDLEPTKINDVMQHSSMNTRFQLGSKDCPNYVSRDSTRSRLFSAPLSSAILGL
jgi:hypothetical protein